MTSIDLIKSNEELIASNTLTRQSNRRTKRQIISVVTFVGALVLVLLGFTLEKLYAFASHDGGILIRLEMLQQSDDVIIDTFIRSDAAIQRELKDDITTMCESLQRQINRLWDQSRQGVAVRGPEPKDKNTMPLKFPNVVYPEDDDGN